MKRRDVTADVGLYLKMERPGSRLFGLGRGVVSLCELVERLIRCIHELPLDRAIPIDERSSLRG